MQAGRRGSERRRGALELGARLYVLGCLLWRALAIGACV